MKRALVMCCLLAAYAPTEATASSRAALEVGVVGGLQLMSTEADLLGTREAGVTMDDAAVAGIRAAYHLEGLPISGQILVTGFPAVFYPGTMKGTGALVLAETLLRVEFGSIRLSAGGGVGALALVAGNAGEDTDLAYSVGMGVRWAPESSTAALRLDGRALFSDGAGDSLAMHTLWLMGVDFVLTSHHDALPPTARVLDRDGDGIADRDDRCPGSPGAHEHAGCPDTDRDGVVDARDACPDTSGLAQYHGCPDTDGDTVPDTTDACPTIRGTVADSGCPDSDRDGIADDRDQCPQRPGTRERDGCPMPSEAVLSAFGRPLDGVKFVGSPPSLTLASQDVIRGIAAILDEYPDIHLQVRGHSHGRDRSNDSYDESEERAAVIARALVAEGIDPARLSVLGLGSEQPIASNRTSAGRARNHRVEVHVVAAESRVH